MDFKQRNTFIRHKEWQFQLFHFKDLFRRGNDENSEFVFDHIFCYKVYLFDIRQTRSHVMSFGGDIVSNSGSSFDISEDDAILYTCKIPSLHYHIIFFE